MTFGELLRTRREELGFSRMSVATAIGKHHTLIGKLERDQFDTPERISIGNGTLDNLSVVLDIDRDELYRAYGKLPNDVLEYLVVTPGALDAVRRAMDTWSQKQKSTK